MFTPICKKPKPVKDYTNYNKTECIMHQKDFLSPVQPSRILICGSTGKGKTNLLLSLVFEHLTFTRIYINCKDQEESKYQMLKDVLEQVKAKDKKHLDFYWFNSASDNIISVDDLDKNEVNLIIFDDFLVDKSAEDKINELFIRGRKKNSTIIYISQSYFKTPKIVRLQCNYKCFFKCADNREIHNIFLNEAGCLDKSIFIKLYHEATFKPFNFFFIDTETEDLNLQFRKNFDSCFIQEN